MSVRDDVLWIPITLSEDVQKLGHVHAAWRVGARAVLAGAGRLQREDRPQL